MPGFTTEILCPLDLVLDVNNPRFILPIEPTQEAVRLHLLKHEGVTKLAEAIVQFGGLMPGERPIIFRQNGQAIVIEGNRRVTAYQLLLNPNLVPETFQGRIPSAVDELKAGLSTIPVDVIESREEAGPILASRHIEGIKTWPTLSKMQFFVKEFERGKTIDVLEREAPGVKRTEIKALMNEYYLFKDAINLPVWTPEQLNGPLNQQDIEVTRFTRIFNTKKAKAALGLSFDESSYRPVWTRPAEAVNKILEIIMHAAFISKKIDTRTTNIWAAPGLKSYLDSIDKKDSDSPQAEGSNSKGADKGTHHTDNQDKTTTSTEKEKSTDHKSKSDSESRTQSKETPKKKRVPGDLGFFETISPGNLNPSDTHDKAILILAKEIQSISTVTSLTNFPNAAAMLLRSLLEQLMKRHLRHKKQWDEFYRRLKGRDPGTQDLIGFFSSNLGLLIPAADDQRLYNAVINTPGIRDILNLIIHQTHKAAATKEMLIAISKAGLFGFIQMLLDQ